MLKSHGDRTNTSGGANGAQEMSVLITNSLPGDLAVQNVLDKSI